jgi:hypothetical protein
MILAPMPIDFRALSSERLAALSDALPLEHAPNTDHDDWLKVVLVLVFPAVKRPRGKRH